MLLFGFLLDLFDFVFLLIPIPFMLLVLLILLARIQCCQERISCCCSSICLACTPAQLSDIGMFQTTTLNQPACCQHRLCKSPLGPNRQQAAPEKQRATSHNLQEPESSPSNQSRWGCGAITHSTDCSPGCLAVSLRQLHQHSSS